MSAIGIWRKKQLMRPLRYLELGISVRPYRKYIKTAKNGGFCLVKMTLTVLANFCYGYSANSSEAVQKFATDQTDYQKCTSCVTVAEKKGWLLGHL